MGKIDVITICLNFCYEILSQSQKDQKYQRNNDQLFYFVQFG